MKLEDFEFRLVLTPAQLVDLQCDNSQCPCQTPLVYGDPAKCMLVEFMYSDAQVELWTGLKDKNGTKIYEGDIVCFKNRGKYNDDRDEVLAKYIKEKYLKKTFLAQIFFKNVGGGYCIESETNKGTRYFSLFDMFFYLNFKLEVVGNIHENPELLHSHSPAANPNT